MTMTAPLTTSAPRSGAFSLADRRASFRRALLTRRHAAGALYGVIAGSAFTASALSVGAVMASAFCGG